MSFSDLNLHSKILQALSDSGYKEPSLIQKKVIPKILKGFDIRASAQTGTGKTAAFLLPALQLLSEPSQGKSKGPRVLVLAPTRELAMQVAVQAEKYSQHLRKIKTVCVVGGVPYPVQLRKLTRPHDILIATPGRLIDFIEKKKIDLSHVELLILDEADRMLDMGFLEPVEHIVDSTPDSRQTLLFSATLHDKEIQKLSDRFLKNPMEIVAHSQHAKHDNIQQKLHYADDLNHKNKLLDHILGEEDMGSVIVFTSTKRHADQLVGELYEKGHRAAALHGDMHQRKRTKTIERLKKGSIRIIVATDVAARGIDVQSITHVINFDLPRNVEDYVHRIGRTGRAGAKGTALSFAAKRDSGLVKRIETFTGSTIDVVEIPGLEPLPTKKRGSRPRRPHHSHSGRSQANRNHSKRSFNRRPRKARAT